MIISISFISHVYKQKTFILVINLTMAITDIKSNNHIKFIVNFHEWICVVMHATSNNSNEKKIVVDIPVKRSDEWVN